MILDKSIHYGVCVRDRLPSVSASLQSRDSWMNIIDCLEKLSGFSQFLPDQFNLIDGLDDFYLYNFDEPDIFFIHPGVYAERCERKQDMDMFEKRIAQMTQTLDNIDIRFDARIEIFEKNILILNRAHIELMKPVDIERQDLLSLFRNVIKYHRLFTILHRDQILEPIAECQKQFSFGNR